MLLIPCPWCGPRDEVEFRYGGEAHIARPAEPDAVDDAAWAEYLYMRANPKGLLAERWVHAHGCRRWFNLLRDTVSHRILAAYRIGERAARRCLGRDPAVSPAGRRRDRPQPAPRLPLRRAGRTRGIPATRWPRRCSPTASGSWRAASSTTGRAAFSRPGSRSRRRWCSWRPAATPSRTAAPGEIALYDGLRAASQHAWPSLAADLGRAGRGGRAAVAGRVLLQDLPAPQALWAALWEPLLRRMAGLGRAPAEPDPARYDKRHAHCDVLVVGGGPAGLAAALAAGRGGARVILADSDAVFGGALLRRAYRIGDGDGAAWAETAVAELASLPELRLLPATTVVGHYDGNYLIAVERVGELLGADRAGRAAAPAAVAHPRPPGGAGDRRVRTAAGLRRQRPARHHAGERGRDLPAPLRGDAAAGAPCCSPTTTTPIRSPPRWRPPGSRSPASSIRAPRRARRRGGWSPACRSIPATTWSRPPAAWGCAGSGCGRSAGAAPPRSIATCSRCRAAGTRRVQLFAQAQGRLRYDERLARSCRRQCDAAVECVGAARGSFGLAACLAEGAAAGARAAALCGFGTGEAPPPPAGRRRRRGNPRAAAVAVAPRRPPRLRRPAQRRDRRRHRAGGARRLSRDPEHAKRYTTLGMGTDQGKTGNLAGLALLAAQTGRGHRGDPADDLPAALCAVSTACWPGASAAASPTRCG